MSDVKKGFSQQVYQAVAQIPRGSVATYGQIAMMIGRPRAARQVGTTISAAPFGHNLPFHRVVNRLGEMAPAHAFGGRHIQRTLLEKEGIGFLQSGRVDMQKHLWRPAAEAGVNGILHC
ncbi:methylated-DNA--[protein]-cysteine S-methyltransferase [Clostridia bacterium OttesenSCG-928-F22]|nr:methylated-DNA--[protein]-cysteine S-methyltransferase [Clostridia bacterium OttesenSCG-928-F22]